MPEVVEEVRIDFKTLSVLSKETREAAKNAAVLSKHFSQLNKDAGQIAKVLNAPTGLPKAAKDSAGLRANLKESGLAIAAIGTAASAAFFKMAQLANPAAVERLNRALRDTTAVLGHTLTPYLELAERGVRKFGDALANAPEPVQQGIGLSLAGGATLLGGAAVLGTGAWAYRQYRGAATGLQGAYKVATARPPIAPPPLPEASALDRALGMPATRAPGPVPPPLPRAPSMMGRAASFLGKAAPFIQWAALPIEGLQLSAESSPFGAARVARSTSSFGLSEWVLRKVTGKSGEQMQTDLENTWLGRQAMKGWEGRPLNRFKQLTGVDVNPFNWFSGDKTSFGAAAQPAEYQDVLGAIMNMRQAVASGAGNDPASQTAENTGKTASLLEQMLHSPSKGGFDFGAGIGSTVAGWFGGGNGRGTGGR
jgi:hypothetical protein